METDTQGKRLQRQRGRESRQPTAGNYCTKRRSTSTKVLCTKTISLSRGESTNFRPVPVLQYYQYLSQSTAWKFQKLLEGNQKPKASVREAMSRSALWRQETNVQERDRIASEIFETAVHEGKEVSAPIALTIIYSLKRYSREYQRKCVDVCTPLGYGLTISSALAMK